MSRSILLVMALLMLANCGIRRPLIAPKDMPAFEQKRQKRLDKLQDTPDADAAPAPAQPATPTETPAPTGQ